MKLIEYLKTLSMPEREALAARMDTHPRHLLNVGYGYRNCSEKLAAQLEAESGGKVTRQELRPDDWHVIWPELIGQEGAPPVPVVASVSAG